MTRSFFILVRLRCRPLRFFWTLLVVAAVLQPTNASAYRIVGIAEQSDLASEYGWRDTLSEIQRNLSALGYYKGPKDGRFNEATQRAIQRYRRRNGIIDHETIWPSVLGHMKALGEAVRMQKSLTAARTRQIDQAESRLMEHAAARSLLAKDSIRETADPTHDATICLAAPTLRCLLDEALESIRGVSRERYRNWALQDLIRALAEAGMVTPMKAALRRISDARLILVSLRDGIDTMAAAGHMSAAEETLVLMPDGIDRARALLALATAWRERGNIAAARDVLRGLPAEIDVVEDRIQQVLLKTELAVQLVRAGDGETGREILADLRDEVSGHAQTANSLAHIAAAYARIGEANIAESMLVGAGGEGFYRRAQIALANAYAKRGNASKAVATAERIYEPRYRVVALCDVARELLNIGDRSGGATALDRAYDHLPKVEGEFATDYAWSCIAEVHGAMGDRTRAGGAVGHIESPDVEARTLWRLWFESERALRAVDAAEFEAGARRTTGLVDTFKRVSIWSDAAAMAARLGLQENARSYLARAIDVVGGMKTRWWRARALSRIAEAVVIIETTAARN